MNRLAMPTVLACTVVCALSVVAAALAVATAPAAFAQQNPEFKLGFKSLADQIPEVVGEPLENERWGDNGDSLQQTTRGLMAWRKADNWTAFTNGSRTWVNGPSGVRERGNEERFEWESPANTATPDDAMEVCAVYEALLVESLRSNEEQPPTMLVIRDHSAALPYLEDSPELQSEWNGMLKRLGALTVPGRNLGNGLDGVLKEMQEQMGEEIDPRVLADFKDTKRSGSGSPARGCFRDSRLRGVFLSDAEIDSLGSSAAKIWPKRGGGKVERTCRRRHQERELRWAAAPPGGAHE